MQIDRLLITGAAGALGTQLRRHYAGKYPKLRLSDRDPMGEPGPGEELIRCELADAPAVERLFEGVDACVHLGGQPVEGDWPTVLNANIIGNINTWEAARKAGTKRILYASSNHAIGFYPRSQKIDHTAPPKPDSRYGLSKAFAEDLGHLYANKHAIDCFVMRIGSCFPEPKDERMLATWLSYADFCRLCDVGLEADYRYEIVYGVSNNPRSFWDNGNAERLGYKPQDSAEVWADRITGKLYENDLDNRHHGGGFVSPEFTGELDRLV